LSRADFLLDATDNITLLEVNTLPGMTPTSLYPDGAAALGLNFDELIDLLVRTAFIRSTH
jgi:D-alanine-D-alanine ligase